MPGAVEQSQIAVEAQDGDRLSLGQMEDSIGLLLRLAQLATFDAVWAIDPHDDLSLPERTVLVVIEANPEARQGAIADALRIKWPHMTKLVRGLEQRGLIERFVPAEDRRSVFLRLTDAGAGLLAGLKPRMARIDHESLPMLDDRDRADMARLLRKVAGLPHEAPPA